MRIVSDSFPILTTYLRFLPHIRFPRQPISFRADTRIVLDTRYAYPAKLLYMGPIYLDTTRNNRQNKFRMFLNYFFKKQLSILISLFKTHFWFFFNNPVGMGHGPYRILWYRTPIRILGQTWKSMTYWAVTPYRIRRIGGSKCRIMQPCMETTTQ